MFKRIAAYINKHETLTALVLFTLIEIVSIGINIPKLGFYHDDWYLLWSGFARGADSIIPMFSTDRPFMGFLYSYTYRLFGESLLAWHIFAFVLRLLGGFGFYGILKKLFPNQRGLNFFMVAIFYIYPGFLSQPDANTKQNHLIGYGLAIFSIYFTLLALTVKNTWARVSYSIGSGLMALNYFFIYEYMIGLEAARLIFIGILLYREQAEAWRPRVMEAIKVWIPVPVVTAIFLYWRFFIFESTRSATNVTKLASNYLDDFQVMSYRLVFQSIRDMFDVTLFAWYIKPYNLFKNSDNTDLFIGLALGFVMAVLAIWWMKGRDEEGKGPDPRMLMIAGWAIVFAAVFPVVLSNREFDPLDAYKSYGLHPTMGVALFFGGLYAQSRKQFGRVVILIVFLIAIPTQYLNGVDWANLWKAQTDTWWQLSWRAPDLEDGTILVIDMPSGRRYRENYEIWGPANMIYRDGAAEIPVISAEILTPDIFVNASYATQSGATVRDISVPLDYTKLLILSRSDMEGCLSVTSQDLPIYSDQFTHEVTEVIEHSNEGLIKLGAEQITPLTDVFGPEPVHGWCYYYQKASLALQQQDIEQVISYYRIVKKEELEARDSTEWLPYVIAFAQNGDIDKARELYRDKLKRMERFEIMTCAELETGVISDPRFLALTEVVCNK